MTIENLTGHRSGQFAVGDTAMSREVKVDGLPGCLTTLLVCQELHTFLWMGVILHSLCLYTSKNPHQSQPDQQQQLILNPCSGQSSYIRKQDRKPALPFLYLLLIGTCICGEPKASFWVNLRISL